ncbi:MAG: polysaccharide biosynthesis tyrosine autokinase [Acidobacteriota bacterium]|nr:polysaccharide biosynthesis tyrosine autokinase [Acidobacteriota bacterium]
MERTSSPPIPAAAHHAELPTHAQHDSMESSSTSFHTSLLAGFLPELQRARYGLLVTVLCGVLVGFVLYLREPPIYKAVTTLEVQGLNETFMNMNVVDPQAGLGNYSPNSVNIMTQLRIIESASLRSAALERLKKTVTPRLPPEGKRLTKLRSILSISPQSPQTATAEALEVASRTIVARTLPGTRIIVISADSTDPVVAAQYLNTLAAEYLEQNLRLRLSTALRTSQWLSTQVEETKRKLDQAEDRIQEFVNKTGSVFIGDQETLVTSKLKQVQMDLAAIQSERIAKQSKYQMTLTNQPDSIPDVLSDPTLRGYQSKITDLQRERAALLTTLMPGHYKVKRIEDQIAQVSGTLEKEKSNVIQRIRNEYDAASKREQVLSGAYASLSHSVVAQSDRAAQYSMLKRDAEILRQSLNTILLQANQAGITAAVPTNNARQIDAATPPPAPFSPNPATKSLQGAGAAALLGCSLIALKGISASRLSTNKVYFPGFAGALLNVPELAVIPSAGANARRHVPLFLKKQFRQQSPKGGLVLTTHSGPDAVASWRQSKRSMLSDSFRMALAAITLGDAGRDRSKLIVVTSPGPCEGKTTIASNLAVVGAQTNRRVLLVDADLHRPNLHKMFNVENARGLRELGSDRNTPTDEELLRCIQSTGVPGLSLMTSGNLSFEELGPLFYSTLISKLFERLREKFEIVIIDTPPMLQFPEARLIGKLSDGIVLIFRSGITDRHRAVECGKKLTEDGIPLIGTILNDWSPTHAEKERYVYYDQSARRV